MVNLGFESNYWGREWIICSKNHPHIKNTTFINWRFWAHNFYKPWIVTLFNKTNTGQRILLYLLRFFFKTIWFSDLLSFYIFKVCHWGIYLVLLFLLFMFRHNSGRSSFKPGILPIFHITIIILQGSLINSDRNFALVFLFLILF